ncbi:hypothetical protein [Xanthobacter versatilis]|uniref:hypothetical protein n=1 Tax=Xanthobacter autotrophicus (strain ATCC BAA-1158 / Py2) TaxID=78245 RepID=UPI00372954DE
MLRTLATGGGNATASGVNFQQSLGALFGLWMLTETPVDHRLQLGAATVTAIRMETEAPLDDALATTSEGGVITAQAKNTLSLSEIVTSEFGKTVEQIVRQWHLCRDGAGDLGWNRPLDQSKDRFVIAVGPDSPATTRVNLAKGLEARRQPGKPLLTAQETKALKQFDACVRNAWAVATTEPLTEEILQAISSLTYVYTLDPTGADRSAWAAALAPTLVSPADAQSVLNMLERVAGDLMSARGGRTVATLRSDLLGRGARLAARPDFHADIAALTAYSLQTEQTLTGLEVVEAEAGVPVGITRRCQSAVNAAALSGDLLLIGEPGAGKSAVINALCRALRAQGHDVVLLAVDRFSVESLEGLSRALGLQHDLPAVLGAWDGPGPSFLLIDALDASRGGSGEAAFKRLIESVIELNGRWTVVASIRTFDLRLGQNFRTLFKGTATERALQGEGFTNVRHVQIQPWCKDEFDELLARAPRLADVLQHTADKMRELAMVPFNTRLLADLVATGAVSQDFTAVDSQIALLNLYWDWRVKRHGAAAEVCLRSVVGEMVASRSLRAPRLKVAAANPGILDTLTGEGVLILTNGERSVQFRHHLLFDYVTNRVYLDADGVVEGTSTFPKAEGVGLILAPAMGFLLQTLWSEDADHKRFWVAISNLLGAPDCDPVIRSVAARMAAELPVTAEDIHAFARAINAGERTATTALHHVAGAVAVRLEDEPEAALAPWVNLELQLSAKPAAAAGVLRMMGFMLIDRVRDPALRADLGVAVRALLAHGYGLENSRNLATPAIGFVADMIATDVHASVALLREVLTDDRFNRFGSEELPTLARKISAIAPASPAFAAEIYQDVFGRQVTENRETSIGGSQILSLTSNARQDFESARWSLKEYFPRFLAASPVEATQALLAALAGYVARAHPPSEGMNERTFDVLNAEVRLQQDHSYIWAHEAHPDHAQDADALLSQFETWLETGDETGVLAAADYAVRHGNLAVMWSRLFMAAAARGGALAALLRPYAAQPEFLIPPDTRKDAIDLVAAQYDALPESEQRALETELLAQPFDDFAHPEAAKERFLRSLLGTIGADRLVTDAAREAAGLVTTQDRETSNPRLFRSSVEWGAVEDYPWLSQETKAEPVVRETIAALDAVRMTLRLEVNGNEPIESLETALADLAGLKIRLDAGSIPDASLMQRAEGTFAQGIQKIVNSDHVSAETPVGTVAQLMGWIEDASRFSNPQVQEDTEAQFESHSSWSSPSARLEAAEAALDLCLKRPESYPVLAPMIDRMLADPHPAVRMNAALRLVRIWDMDREGFWSRATHLIATEDNRGVLDLFVCKTLGVVQWHGGARKAADLVLPLIERCPASEVRNASIRRHLVQMTLQFWLRFDFEDAAEQVRAWFVSAVDHADDVRDAMQWLREAFTAGLRGTDDTQLAPQRMTAVDLLGQAVARAAEALTHYATLSKPTEAETARARSAMQIVDTACQQLYFSSGAFRHGEQQRAPLTLEGGASFLHETAPILRLIGEHGGPHTVYYLIQLLEHLVKADPPGVFDLIAFAVLKGGQQSGYQFESLAADLMVKLVGNYLADHKEIFDDPQRRTALVDTLETFVAAGWPSVRRLFYRLPELLR